MGNRLNNLVICSNGENKNDVEKRGESCYMQHQPMTVNKKTRT